MGGDEASKDRLKGLRKRTGRNNGILRTSHFRGSDKLHCHRDLLCVFHRYDTVTDGIRFSVHENCSTTVVMGSSTGGADLITQILSNIAALACESSRGAGKGTSRRDQTSNAEQLHLLIWWNGVECIF